MKLKLKSKLIISFCITIFAPIFLACIIAFGFLAVQVKLIEHNYGIQDLDAYSITNMVQLLNRYTVEDFENIIEVTETAAAKLENTEFLQRLTRN